MTCVWECLNVSHCFFFLKIVINCQIFTIQSQLPKSAAAGFYSYEIKAKEVTGLFENAATFSNKSNSNRVWIWFYNKIRWKSISFVCFRSSNTPFFVFSEVGLLVCFGALSCWKPRCVCHKLHILCQKVIQVLRQPPEHPATGRFEGHRDVVWQKRNERLITIYMDCFCLTLKLMIWNNSAWQMRRKQKNLGWGKYLFTAL